MGQDGKGVSSVTRIAPMLAACLALGACGTPELQAGRDFDVDAFATRVERGVTTRDDVRSWIGAPASTGVSVETSGARFEQWTYYLGKGGLSSLSQTTLKLLQVKFDQHGIVQGYEYSNPTK